MNRTLFSFIDTANSVKNAFCSGRTRGKKLASLLSRSSDCFIENILKEKVKSEVLKDVCLIATGGYGREELFPGSDLDLLFVFDESKEPPEKEIKRIIYPLWDMNINFGYSIRTIRESLDLAGHDIKVLTSLLDSRLLSGSKKLYEFFRASFIKDVLRNRADQFVDDIKLLRENRSKKNGDSVYLLEPELKNGKGALRDYHTALWLAKVVFGVSEFKELLGRGFLKKTTLQSFNRSLDYIFDIRHRLHLISGSGSERLSFEVQDKIAKERGYKPARGNRGVEKLMRSYYGAATVVDSFCDLMFEKADSFLVEGKVASKGNRRKINSIFLRERTNIIVSSGKTFLKNPLNIIKAFSIAKDKNLRLHEYLKELMMDNSRSKKRINWDKNSLVLLKRCFLSPRGFIEH